MPALSWLDDSGATVHVEFDVVETESHEGTVEITEHPVEQGESAADHARAVPERLSIEAFVSNTPSLSNPGVGGIAGTASKQFKATTTSLGPSQRLDLQYPPPSPGEFFTLGGAIRTGINLLTRPTSIQGRGANQNNDTQVGAQVLAFQGFTNRVRQIAEKLADARLKGRLIRVTTTLRDYDNMLIERESEPRTVDDGTGCKFQIDLKRIRIVSSQTVDAPKPAEARGSPKATTGSKSGTADPNDAAKRAALKSTAASLADGAAGALGL